MKHVVNWAYPTFPAQIPSQARICRTESNMFIGFGMFWDVLGCFGMFWDVLGLLGRPGEDERLSEDEWSEGMLWLCRRQELRLAGEQLLQWTKEMERKPRKIAWQTVGSCIIFYTLVCTLVVLPSNWPRYAPMNW